MSNVRITISIPESLLDTFEDMANIAHMPVNDLISQVLAEAEPSLTDAVESLISLSDAYRVSKAAANS